MVILSSSAIGAYVLWRGFSILLGGFPNERMLDLALEKQQLRNVSYTFWLWVTLMIITTAASIFI